MKVIPVPPDILDQVRGLSMQIDTSTAILHSICAAILACNGIPKGKRYRLSDDKTSLIPEEVPAGVS